MDQWRSCKSFTAVDACYSSGATSLVEFDSAIEVVERAMNCWTMGGCEIFASLSDSYFLPVIDNLGPSTFFAAIHGPMAYL